MDIQQALLDVAIILGILGFFAFLIFKNMLESKSPLALKIVEYLQKPRNKLGDMKDRTEQIYHDKREIM